MQLFGAKARHYFLDRIPGGIAKSGRHNSSSRTACLWRCISPAGFNFSSTVHVRRNLRAGGLSGAREHLHAVADGKNPFAALAKFANNRQHPRIFSSVLRPRPPGKRTASNRLPGFRRNPDRHRVDSPAIDIGCSTRSKSCITKCNRLRDGAAIRRSSPASRKRWTA